MSDSNVNFQGLVDQLSKTDTQIASNQALYQGLALAVNEYVTHGTSLGDSAQLLSLAQKGHTTVEQLVEDALGKLMADTFNASIEELNALSPLQNALASLHNSNPSANLNDWLNNVQGDTADLQNIANATSPQLPIFKTANPDNNTLLQKNNISDLNRTSLPAISSGNMSINTTSKEYLIVKPDTAITEKKEIWDLEFLDDGYISNGNSNILNGLDSIVDPVGVIDPVDRAIDKLLFHPVETLTHPFHTIKDIFNQTLDDVLHP